MNSNVVIFPTQKKDSYIEQVRAVSEGIQGIALSVNRQSRQVLADLSFLIISEEIMNQMQLSHIPVHFEGGETYRNLV